MLKLFKSTQSLKKFLFQRSNTSIKPFSTNTEFRGNNRKPYNLKIGDTIENFKLEEIQEFPDFNIKSYSLTHQKTGASFLHLDTSDQNNCFSIIFKTLPSNDKGFFSFKTASIIIKILHRNTTYFRTFGYLREQKISS